MYICPKCSSIKLTVNVIVTADFVQEGDDNYQTVLDGGDHTWDDDSHMHCKDCGHWAVAEKFFTANQVLDLAGVLRLAHKELQEQSSEKIEEILSELGIEATPSPAGDGTWIVEE